MTKKIDITQRAGCDPMKKEIETALATLAHLGVHFEVGRMTYGSKGMTAKIEISHIGEDGTAATPERVDFERYATSYGLEASDLDREFKDYDGSTWVIVGLKPKSRKYPILVQNVHGKVYKFPAERVTGLLKAA